MTSLLDVSVWALPIIFSAALIIAAFVARFTDLLSHINWPIVDLIWITSSALTLYFLAVGMIYDSSKSEGQLAANNYMSHVTRGRDKSNDNLSRFCVGPTRRILQINPTDQQNFCRYNSDALSAFTQKLVIHDKNNGFTRETDLDRIPIYIVRGPGGQDAVVANIEWAQVRDEFIG